MFLYFISGICTFFILLSFLVWLLCYNPMRKIKNSLKNTIKNLNKELRANEDFDFMQSGYRMFKDKKLAKIWDEYNASESVKKRRFQYSNIKEYFSEENIIGRLVNTSFTSSIPMVIFVIGIILGAVYTLIYAYQKLLTEDIVFRAAVLIFFAGISSLFFFIYNKILIFQTRKHILEFSRWISIRNNEYPSINEQLGDLRHTMHSYQQEQLKFYSQLSDHIAVTMQKAIKPFLDDTKIIIEDFVSAASDKQIESMEHLAEYFVANTTKLYSEQIERLTETTSAISSIQTQTAESLKSVTTIYTESKDCIKLISDTSSNTLVRYDTYLEKVDSMNSALVSSARHLDDLVEFIRINSQNQSFTIENLSKFQQDLIDVSERSTNAMKLFFDDFNDHFTSSVIALHSASNDIMNASELLKGSYNEMAENVNVDVNKVFSVFEENLATISVHLSETIHDLQDAIDELPEILRRISDSEK